MFDIYFLSTAKTQISEILQLNNLSRAALGPANRALMSLIHIAHNAAPTKNMPTHSATFILHFIIANAA